MYPQAALALLSALSAVSALPQSSSSSSSSGLAAPAAGSNDSFARSFNQLYVGGTTLVALNLSWTAANSSVLSIYASTGEQTSAASLSTTQQPLKQMDIQYLPLGQNSTRLIDVINYGYNSTDSLDSDYTVLGSSNGSASPWAYSAYNATDTSDYIVMTPPDAGFANITTAIDLLAAKNISGPWNEITISQPVYEPSPNDDGSEDETPSANPTVWMQFSSYGNNSLSYMVNPSSGRVFPWEQ